MTARIASLDFIPAVLRVINFTCDFVHCMIHFKYSFSFNNSTNMSRKAGIKNLSFVSKFVCKVTMSHFPRQVNTKANGKQWQISIREVMNTPYKSLESQKSMTNGDHFGYSTAFLLILLSLCIYLFFFFPTISSLFDITALSTWSLLEFSCLKYVTYAWILHPTVKLVPRGPSPSLTRAWSETVNLADMKIKVEMTLSRRLSKLVYLLNLIFMHL